MADVQITVLSDMIPVDRYDDDDNGLKCPIATQKADVNEDNRRQAVATAGYRDPAGSGAFRVSNICGNCKAYDQTKDMLKCIGDDSRQLGYCQLLKFVCRSCNTCNKWVEGGPITAKVQQSYPDNL